MYVFNLNQWMNVTSFLLNTNGYIDRHCLVCMSIFFIF